MSGKENVSTSISNNRDTDAQHSTSVVRKNNVSNNKELVKDFDAAWGKIKHDSILHIFELVDNNLHAQFDKKMYLHLYTTIFNMSNQPTPYNWSGKFYYSFSDAIAEQCNLRILPRLSRYPDGTGLLEAMVTEWKKFLLVLKWCTFVFRYLNKFYASRLALPTLHEVGIMHFRDQVYRPMSKRLTEAFLTCIQEERTVGGRVCQEVLKDTRDIYLTVGMNSLRIYRSDLESHFLKQSREYMKTLSRTWLNSCTCIEYLGNAERQYQSESARVKRYLHESSESKLMAICVEQLVHAPRESVIEMPGSGCREMLDNCDQAALKLLFQLYKDIPEGIMLIANNFKNHLQRAGAQIMEEMTKEASSTNKKRNAEFTALQKMIDTYSKFRQLTAYCFHDHLALFRSLKIAFEVFLNFKPGDVEGDFCVAERLSEYLDRLLRGNVADVSLTSPLAKTHLEAVVDVFSFVNDKDVFVESYRKRLAKRLLLERSSNEELECTVIEYLRKTCGAPFVSKVAGILKDMVAVKLAQTEFNDHCKAKDLSLGNRKLYVKVLTSGYWPTYKKDSLQLPKGLVDNLNTFETYYKERTAHRTLTWIHSLGTMVISAKLPSNRYDLVLNTYQGCVMLLFNEMSQNTQDSLTMTQVCSKLGMSGEQLGKHIISLAFGKYKLLESSADTITAVGPGTRFSVNEAFVDKSRRIKVPLISTGKSSQDTDKDKEVNMARINEDRKYVIEATVVRIMKVRKQLTHTQLVAETTSQLLPMFKLDLKLLKGRLEDLISRDYIERHTQDKNTYVYVA